MRGGSSGNRRLRGHEGNGEHAVPPGVRCPGAGGRPLRTPPGQAVRPFAAWKGLLTLQRRSPVGGALPCA